MTAVRPPPPLMTLASGEAIGLAEGFIPRLVRWTEEDKAAKGLRSLSASQTQPQPPVHFSALEMIQENRATLLLADSGGGKSTLARHLALCLAGENLDGVTFSLDRLARIVPRNDLGDSRMDGWRGAAPTPVLKRAEPGLRFSCLIDAPADGTARPSRLLILDDTERLGDGLRAFLDDAGEALTADPGLRLLLLGETQALKALSVPAWLSRHDLLPLLLAQRRTFAQEVLAPRGLALTPAAASAAAAHPAVFALALRTQEPVATTEADRRRLAEGRCRSGARGARRDGVRARSARGSHAGGRSSLGRGRAIRGRASTQRTPVRQRPAPALRGRRAAPALMEALIRLPGDAGLRGALLAAQALDRAPQQAPPIIASLVRLVEEGRLTAQERAEAGRILAVAGDPRDLSMLAEIPGGLFVMGSGAHPNSAPPHRVHVAPFRIGVHPVTNALYGAFIAATGRRWVSPGGRLPERVNMPATDLTWHDARAFCAWLTERWRAEGRIGPQETVRLPTEPEWERAARGDQIAEDDAVIHPWGLGWNPDRANAEDAGFNDTVAVGLFPAGRSPYGCQDMAGQVWEWCSTLWGTDMATPPSPTPTKPTAARRWKRRTVCAAC